MANNPRQLTVSAFVLVVGASLTYKVIEGGSILKSVYWTIMTSTTVGYGDVAPHHVASQTLAMVLSMITVLFYVPMITASVAAKLIVDRNVFTDAEQEELKEGVRELLRRAAKPNEDISAKMPHWGSA